MAIKEVRRTPPVERTWWRWVLWFFRLAPVIAIVALAADIASLARNEPGAAEALAHQANESLGTMALLTLAGTLAVRPLTTLTGWRWHLILGRDLGLWTFGLAMLDLLIAAMTSTSGWLTGIAGTAFVAAGSAAALVMVPLALTSNRWSMQLFGRYWKVLHRLTYAALALITLHLVLLAGVAAVVPLAVLFGPSLVLRVPPVRAAVVRWRRDGRQPAC